MNFMISRKKESQQKSWKNGAMLLAGKMYSTKKGTTWRKLSPEEQQAVNNQDAAIAVLLQYTSAIKRPVVEQKGRAILIGFNEEQYSDFVGR